MQRREDAKARQAIYDGLSTDDKLDLAETQHTGVGVSKEEIRLLARAQHDGHRRRLNTGARARQGTHKLGLQP